MSAAEEMRDMAVRLRRAGWPVVPLTPTNDEPKGIPPRGTTGYRGEDMTVHALVGVNWQGKRLALRLPGDVVGVDVDVRHGGDRGLAELETQYGRLPDTVMAHNFRGDGSGIRLFRVPVGTTLQTDPADGIDMIQRHHRYVIAAPSWHPEGRQYAWLHQAGPDEVLDLPPYPGDLPELPWGWIEGLHVVKGVRPERQFTADELQAFILKHDRNDNPAALTEITTELSAATSRHDTAVRIACRMFRAAMAGHYPAAAGVALLEAWWRQRLADDPGRRDGGELELLLAWAAAAVTAQADDRADEPDADGPAGAGSTAGDDDGKRRNARDGLVALAAGRYVIGRTDDERTYLVPNDGPNVAMLSGSAKAHLANQYRLRTGATVGRSPLDEAWMTLEGIALDVPKAALPLRVAADRGALVLDLGGTDGRAVMVTEDGWQVIDRSPVTFRRSKAMLPLPEPERGGDVAELLELLNVRAHHHELFIAWLMSALFESMPHPVPVLRGEQGAAKTTTARCIAMLLDPCLAQTQKPPKAEEDWAQSCVARWIIAVDNVSTVPAWWSDALCRVVTGDGWLRRQLYTDDEVAASQYRRCVVLNGISLGEGLRADLAERLILFDLDRPARRLTENEVNDRLRAMTPRVLGALLDRAVAAMAAMHEVDIPRDLRMADFAHLLAAYDRATGAQALDAYRAQVAAAFAEALDDDPLAQAVMTFMAGKDEWIGTPAELLQHLNRQQSGEQDDGWPRRASALTRAMTRSAPVLRRVGIGWEVLPRTASARRVRVTHNGGRNDGNDHREPAGHDGNDGNDGNSPLAVSGKELESSRPPNTTVGKRPSSSSLPSSHACTGCRRERPSEELSEHDGLCTPCHNGRARAGQHGAEVLP